MHELALIGDLATVWLAAFVVGSIFNRLKLPVIAGYIIAGFIVGPFGLKLIAASDQIKTLAELGVALLLFALGVELCLRKVFASAKLVIVAGILQIIFTVIFAIAILSMAGITHNVSSAILAGFICTLSSTAVVTKTLVDRAETESAHGRILIPILILQDLALVPVIALLPSMQAPQDAMMAAIVLALLKAVGVVLVVIFGSKFAIPRLLAFIARADSRELFTLSIISICLTISIIAWELGLSLALGAFLAGIMISERPYGLQVLSEILPLRDLFATLFFVSVGLLLNPVFIYEHSLEVITFCLLLIIGKAVIAGFSSLVATKRRWTAALVGISLAQIGEFSFVLATLGYTQGLINDHLYQLVFAGAVVTLLISPTLIDIACTLMKKSLHSQDRSNTGSMPESHMISPDLQGHLVLKGFGRTGRHLGLTLKAIGVPFIVVEIDGKLAAELESLEIPYVFGDALNEHVLDAAHLESASCIVLTSHDMLVNERLVHISRQRNPDIQIIVQANRVDDVDILKAAGANAAIQPEFEASIEITKLALLSMNRPAHEIRSSLANIRRTGSEVFKNELNLDPFVEMPLEEYFGLWFSYDGENETIENLSVRKKSGVTILAVKRGLELSPHPEGSTILQTGDHLYVSGNEHQLYKFEREYPVMTLKSTDELLINES